MKPIKQRYDFVPQVQHGDCWVASLASVLECNIEDFPDWPIFMSFDVFYKNVMMVLQLKGFSYNEYDVSKLKEDALVCTDTDGYCVAIGTFPKLVNNEKTDHCVVWKNGLAFDPDKNNIGISDIQAFGILTKNK